MQNRLYVGNLAGDVSARALQQLFEAHGSVTDVELTNGSKGARPSRFAYVTMASGEAAQAALEALDGTRLHGGQLTVEVAPAGAPAPGRAAQRTIVMPPRRKNPRLEYRQSQTQRAMASVSLAAKFPRLSSLNVNLAYFESRGLSRHSELKYEVNVEHAKSVFCFACPLAECVGGDFDLSQELEKAVASRRKAVEGELRCQGWHKTPKVERVACSMQLRYKLKLNYD